MTKHTNRGNILKILKRSDCLKRVFKPEYLIEFLSQFGLKDVKFIQDGNATVDCEFIHNNKKYYAYASNYTMSVYNKEGITHNFATFWQDYLCDRIEGYPELLVKYMERKTDDMQFKQRRQLNFSADNIADFSQKIDNYNQRIDQIKTKYHLNDLKK